MLVLKEILLENLLDLKITCPKLGTIQNIYVMRTPFIKAL